MELPSNPLKKNHLDILVVIPARGGSKRFAKKNIAPIFGVPLLVWTHRQCEKSRYVSRIVVSTEDPEIKKICADHQIAVIDRPVKLASDQTAKQDVIVHATNHLAETDCYHPDIVISLQPNTPELEPRHLDEAVDFFIEKVFPGNPIKEVITVGTDMIQNGAFRIMTRETVFQKTLSTYVGVYVCDYIDVHYPQDLKKVEDRIKTKSKGDKP